MIKTITTSCLFVFLIYFTSCSSQGKFIKADPLQGESVVIVKRDGKIHEGLFIKNDKNHFIYIDNVSHKAEKIDIHVIKRLERTNRIYDFEANLITQNDISNEKGISRTVGYSIGGLAIGTAVGFGVGVILASTSGVPLLYPMLAGGLGGAYFFGMMGNNSDREVAIKFIRDKRFAKSKKKLQKELLETRQLIEKKKKEKAKLLQEMEAKKKEKSG